MAYGSDEFLNKVSELLGHKYDKEIAVLQQDNVSLQQDKLQSIILLEILADLRVLNDSVVSIFSKLNTPKPADTSKAFEIPSASDQSKRT
jgi:hypothetical protein